MARVTRVKKVLFIKQTQPSYDLEVSKNHNFFANKILVHNCNMYRDYIHARSLTYSAHSSRNWIRRFHASLKHLIPSGWRVCGENCFAVHSIVYRNLTSYFLGFSVWNEKNIALCWEKTIEWFELLGITSVPILFQGELSKEVINRVSKTIDFNTTEGYVIRLADSFHYEDFSQSVAKYVRANHVQTDQHWKHKTIIPNKLRNK